MYIFAGTDSYDSYQAALKQAVELAALAPEALSIVNADELESPGALAQRLQSISLFSAAPDVILAKRLLEDAALREWLVAQPQNTLSTLVVWHDGELGALISRKLPKWMQVKNFDLPKPPQLASWLTGQAKQRAVSLAMGQATEIVTRAGTSKWLLLQELAKLTALAASQNSTTITSQMLDLVSPAEATGNIWRFLDSLSLGRKKTALKELQELLLARTNTQYLMSMLGRELLLLTQVLEGKQTGKPLALKMNSFVLDKLRQKVTRYTHQQLSTLSNALLRLDTAIKQGKIPEEEGLLLFVCSWP